jgi:hypothetical protein
MFKKTLISTLGYKVAAMAIMLSIAACSFHADRYGMTFIAGKCKRSSDLAHLAPTVSSGWDGAIFTVSVKKPAICNAKITNPSYSLTGNQLTVRYDEQLGNEVLKCYCDTESTFRFARLPKANYDVNFETK